MARTLSVWQRLHVARLPDPYLTHLYMPPCHCRPFNHRSTYIRPLPCLTPFTHPAVPVAPGRRLALLARREEGKLRFALRQVPFRYSLGLDGAAACGYQPAAPHASLPSALLLLVLLLWRGPRGDITACF